MLEPEYPQYPDYPSQVCMFPLLKEMGERVLLMYCGSDAAFGPGLYWPYRLIIAFGRSR